jgi:probable HAF family extracellular repeat protein
MRAVAPLGLVVSLSFLAASVWAAVPYRLTELGTLGGTSSTATALNGSGQVTGFSSTPGNAGVHAFLWDGTTLQDLGALGFTSSWGYAINASGQVTGTTQTDDSFYGHAFLWDGAAMLDLGTLGGGSSSGHAINTAGQVTGLAHLAPPDDADYHAFLWDGSTMLDLGTLGGESSSGLDIDDSGRVTGSAQISTGPFRAFLWDGNTLQNLGTQGDGGASHGRAISASGKVTGPAGNHAFLWNGTRMRDLGVLDGLYSVGNAINRAGQVTGLLGYPGTDTDPEPTQPFVWDGTAMHKIGYLSSCLFAYGEGLAINPAGQVTGYIWNNECSQVAFLWDGDPMLELEDIIDPSDPLKVHVTLTRGVDINPRGQIAVNGIDKRTNTARAFLATPLQYRIVFTGPDKGSSWSPGATVPVRMRLFDVHGERISDARAEALAAPPCKVKFSASGAQSHGAACMKYDAAADWFWFDWKLDAAPLGSTILNVSATYRFYMPETITTARSKPITIGQATATTAPNS